MILHEIRLADESHEVAYLIRFRKSGKYRKICRLLQSLLALQMGQTMRVVSYHIIEYGLWFIGSEKKYLTLKAPPLICSRRQFQMMPFFSKITNKAWYFISIVWQAILMKYHTLFFRKFWKILQNVSSAAVVIDTLGLNGQDHASWVDSYHLIEYVLWF